MGVTSAGASAMRWSRGFSLASLLAVASCLDATGVTMPAPFTRRSGDLPHIAGTEQSLATLRQQRDRWRAAAPSRYRVEQQQICFCELTGVRVVEVAGNVLTQAWDRSTGRESEVAAWDLTVDQLFDRAIAVVESGGSVWGAFDAAYGYPRDMYLDPLPTMVDDETNYRLATLTPF
jgi:hypothetical protein